jgi:hypothetical protein
MALAYPTHFELLDVWRFCPVKTQALAMKSSGTNCGEHGCEEFWMARILGLTENYSFQEGIFYK